jgi:phosphate transport system substrate-binding protein
MKHRAPASFLTVALALTLGRLARGSDFRADDFPAYAPEPASLPSKDSGYLTRDGSIFVAGNDIMSDFLDQIDGIFAAAHPGFRFKMELLSSSLAISGITSGKSAFGPMARDATFVDLDAFASQYGYRPLDVLIGWDNNPDAEHFPPAGKFPPGVWVNSRNPVPSLTLEQVKAVFTTGSGKGDITHWGQIAGDEGPVGANGGDWAKREIHVYLPVLKGLPVVSTSGMRLGGLPWTPRAEFLPMMEDVINAVANDPFGIGLIGWWPTDEGWDRQSELGAHLRLLPLAPSADAPVSHGGSGDLYPVAGGIHIYLNRRPGQPLEPWLRDYLRLILSRDGQRILASHESDWGFIPLDPAAAARERSKLD